MSSTETKAGARPRPPRLALEILAFLRAEIRASELWMVVIAAAVGAGAGVATMAIGAAAHGIQQVFYGIGADERLSAQTHLAPHRFLALPLGGAIFAMVTWLWSRRRSSRPVDPVEANALHGGRMSMRDSLFVGLQTLISNGFGASVGLEAAYAQLGGAIASLTGRSLSLRRSDMRTFVGAGAGAAIAAAFDAPLTGAFYAFEIIIGSYTVANLAPVAAAALAGALVTHLANFEPLAVRVVTAKDLSLSHYLLFAGLGLVSGLFGVAIMRLVGWTEAFTAKAPGPKALRQVVGGALLAGIAFAVPQTLSAGHGAMRLDLAAHLAIGALVFLMVAKTSASVIALGFGFRGGLFFASLYLGSLLGDIYAQALSHIHGLTLDPLAASMVGMGALAVAVVGGPFTMSFLVLETTADFSLTAATLTASLVASLFVRETFGYSFSTWRLHLRGETIRSAHDVGWLRTLTAGRMMRTDAATIAASASLAEFRRRFPLGSTRRVIALDDAGRYAGIVAVSKVYADPDEERKVEEEMMLQADWLTPEMSIKEVMSAFDRTASDELAVLNDTHEVLGVLTEAYATRRYAEELEKNRRDLIGGE